MSWFPEQIEGCDEVSATAIASQDGEVAGAEIAPGVVIERRRVLRFSAATVAALMLGPRAARAQAPPRRVPGFGELSMAQFTATAGDLARGLVRTDEPNEDAYLQQLASMMCRLGEVPVPPPSERQVEMAQGFRERHFAVVQIRMAPGSALPWHDHRDYNGVILGLDGAVRIKSFEIVGEDQRPEGTFRIRETVDRMLGAGRVSSLARRRDNIHDLRAGPEGGRLLDVFTLFPGSSGSHYLEVDETPVDPERRIYAGQWRP